MSCCVVSVGRVTIEILISLVFGGLSLFIKLVVWPMTCIKYETFPNNNSKKKNLTNRTILVGNEIKRRGDTCHILEDQ